MLMIVIEAMGTNDSFVSASLAPGSIAGPALGSVAGSAPGSVGGPALGSVNDSALGSVAGLASGSITGPTPGSVNDSTPGFITIPAPGTIAGRVSSVVIAPKTTYFYGKQVITEDYTSLKLYMKRMIWIERIQFSEIIDVWNYMLGILDEIDRTKVVKDLNH